MKYIKTYESITNQTEIDKQLAIGVHRNLMSLVKDAIKAGANPNQDNPFSGYNDNLLLIAVSNNNIVIVKELLKAGANPNCQNTTGNTPLIIASRDRFTRAKVRTGWEWDKYEENVIEELIRAGADWNIKNNEGEDFFDYLIEYFRLPLKEKYPKQYKEYLIKKEADKYNL